MNNKYEKTELRKMLAALLDERMAKDNRVVVLDADLGASMGTMYLREKYPDRMIECGIAEQNMTSLAAGLSSYGYIPFVFSFAPFVSRRVADQIAVSIAYNKEKVVIVGTSPGITAELNGGTHMTFEDVAMMRSFPDVLIFEPSDSIELATAFDQIIDYPGMVYLRMDRKVLPALHSDDYKAVIGKVDVIKEGSDVTLFASGIEVAEAYAAAEILEKDGISAEVVNVHTIKPLDVEGVVASVKKTGCAVTCENHSVYGGLRSAITEALAENYPAPVEAIGNHDRLGEVGKVPYLKQVYHLTAADIAEKAKKAISRK